MRVDRIGVMYRRQRGRPSGSEEEEEDWVDEYMERRCTRENPFTAADKDEIELNIGYILEINGDLVHDAREEAIASLLHLCEICMRFAIERARLGMERLMSFEQDRAGEITPRRELSQVELAALELLTSDWKRATARHANR